MRRGDAASLHFTRAIRMDGATMAPMDRYNLEHGAEPIVVTNAMTISIVTLRAPANLKLVGQHHEVDQQPYG